MWPLFVGIGVGFLLLLAYGWGMATGVKLGKSAQQREHEALRHAAQLALAAHEREAQAWRDVIASAAPANSVATDGRETNESPTIASAEIAHDRTRDAFLALSVVWGEPEPAAKTGKSPANRAVPDVR